MKRTLQDALSSVRTALTSDTGRRVATGLGGAVLAGMGGGAQGIAALGSAVQGVRDRREREKDKEERRNLNRIRTATAELDLQRAQTQQMGDFANMQERILSGAMMPFGRTARDARASGAGGGSGVRGSSTGGLPRVPTQTRTGMRSADPSEVQDEDQLIKNIDRIRQDGATFGADLVRRAGLQNAGIEVLKEHRDVLSDELQAAGLFGEQLEAAWREISRQIAPVHYEQNKAIVEEGVPGKSFADYFETGLSGIAQGSGLVSGAIAGGKAGGMFTLNPLGIGVGAIGGGLMGMAGMDWLSNSAQQFLTGMSEYVYNPSDGSKTPEPLGQVRSRRIGPDDRAQFQPGYQSYPRLPGNVRQRMRPAIISAPGRKPDNLVQEMSLFNEQDWMLEERRRQEEMLKHRHLLEL